MTTINIHKVHDGPFEDKDGDWFMECYVDIDGVYRDATIYFQSFDCTYEVIRHMKSPTLKPYKLEADDE